MTKEKLIPIILSFAYIVGVFLFSLYVYPHQTFPSSPDERAAQTFTERLTQGKGFVILEDKTIPENLRPYIVPRSTAFINEKGIWYASYLGLPTVFALFGNVVPYAVLFALFALLGAISVYGICKYLTKNSFLSLAGAIIYATLPHVLLYSARGFMHNALFVDVLACSLWLLLVGWEKRWNTMLIASGVSLGLAAAIRTNEMLWAAPLYVLAVLYIARRKSLKPIAIAIIASACIFLPFVLLSYSLTQSPVQYQAVTSEVAAQSDSILTFTKTLVFPFGFDLSQSFQSFWHFASHIWWITIALIASILFALFNSVRQKSWYTLGLIVALVLLGIYSIAFYGLFPQEGPKNAVIVSHSHFRYWLAIFAASAIAIPFALKNIAHIGIRLWIIRVIVLGFVIGSFAYLWFGKGGIQDNPYQNMLAYERNKKMHETVPADAIILAGIADKYFFPDWEVAGTNMHADRANFVKKLKESKINRPVYYYFTPADFSSNRTLEAIQAAGIQTEYVTMFVERETLFKLGW